MSNIIRSIGPVNFNSAVNAYADDLPTARAAFINIANHAPIGIHSTQRRHSLRIARDCFILRGGNADIARVFFRLGLRRAGIDA